jgi:hypothetical protein
MALRERDELFAALERSSFRRKFHLGERERAYLARHGLDQVVEHGREFITARLAPARPTADGRQTPLAGHPIFVGQHATATCCRGCLSKWHGIERLRGLEPAEIDYVLGVLRYWLLLESERAVAIAAEAPAHDGPRQRDLFAAEE